MQMQMPTAVCSLAQLALAAAQRY